MRNVADFRRSCGQNLPVPSMSEFPDATSFLVLFGFSWIFRSCWFFSGGTRRCVLIVFSRYRSPCALPIRMTGALSTHGLFDAVGLGTVEELVAACVTRFNVGFDFATILSSPFSSCILFAIVSRQLVELEFWEQQIKLKWMMLKKWRRLFHSSRVKFPFVNISASWCVVSTYLIWIFRFILLLPTSKYMRSGYMSHCWTSAFDDHDNHCCLKGAEHRTELRRRHVWGNIIDIA